MECACQQVIGNKMFEKILLCLLLLLKALHSHMECNKINFKNLSSTVRVVIVENQQMIVLNLSTVLLVSNYLHIH